MTVEAVGIFLAGFAAGGICLGGLYEWLVGNYYRRAFAALEAEMRQRDRECL